MKTTRILILSFLLAAGACTSSMMEPDRQHYINYEDSTARFFIKEAAINKSLKPSITYYYYYKNGIHSNQGAIAGYPLEGEYHVYNTDNNLVCKGMFKNGAKTGKWMRWTPKGNLYSIVKYSNGKNIKVIFPEPVKAKRVKKVKGSVADTSTSTKRKWYQLYKTKSDVKR